MNRVGFAFERAASGGRRVLVAYLCVGDPAVDESIDLALACIDAGADVLELGVPFSDPTADGPAIARASYRAITRAQGGLASTLRAAHAVRRADDRVGLVLFGYYNPLFVRGERRAVEEAAEAGIDALLVVDLPAEESVNLRDLAAARGLGVVPLLAPTSRDTRVAATAAACEHGITPFVYYVSVTGVTGTNAIDPGEASTRAGRLQQALGRPVAVGFGIDSRDKAREAARCVSGAVVGSALVRAIEDGKTAQARRDAVERIVRDLRAGLDELTPAPG